MPLQKSASPQAFGANVRAEVGAGKPQKQEMHLAYVAGLVDGEGNIGFTRIRHRIYPRVFITNTNRKLLEDVQCQFGGDISQAKRANEKWKPAYHWRISNSAATNFLDLIYPWLRLKQDQAALVFLWDAIRPKSGHRWTAEGLEACVLLDAQRKWLNAKGTQDRGIEPMIEALKEVA